MLFPPSHPSTVGRLRPCLPRGRSVYGVDKAITNFPVAEYTARLAAAGIAPPAGVDPPAPAPGAERDATAVLMAALANVVHVRSPEPWQRPTPLPCSWPRGPMCCLRA